MGLFGGEAPAPPANDSICRRESRAFTRVIGGAGNLGRRGNCASKLAAATLRRRDDSPRGDFRNAFLPQRGPHPVGSPRFLARLRSSSRLGSRPSSQSANPSTPPRSPPQSSLL